MSQKEDELPEAETKEAKKRAKALGKNIDRLLVEVQAIFQNSLKKRGERAAFRAMMAAFRSPLRKMVTKLDPDFTRTQIETLVKRLLWLLEEDQAGKKSEAKEEETQTEKMGSAERQS